MPPPLKPFYSIPIEECHAPLVDLQAGRFHGLLTFVEPHPYVALGALKAYGGVSPWQARDEVAEALGQAARHLQAERPGWTIRVFDALRPVAVQRFMVERTFADLAQAEGLNPADITEETRARLNERVAVFWAQPNEDPTAPPPHSTGAALDLTLTDIEGREVNMGSPIDEPSERSFPDHFAESSDSAGQTAHANRNLLARVMLQAGFVRHKQEWWHFSLGDQYWAWRLGHSSARFGRVV